jgi:hypothetical protein
MRGRKRLRKKRRLREQAEFERAFRIVAQSLRENPELWALAYQETAEEYASRGFVPPSTIHPHSPAPVNPVDRRG